MAKNKHKIAVKKNYIFFFLVLFIVFSFTRFKIFSSRTEDNTLSTPVVIIPDRIPPKGFKEYQSRQYRFSLFFPDDLSISQFSEKGGGQTAVFESKDGSKGFQIYVIPYDKDHITDERFKGDVPSGVRKNSLDVIVDGVIATTFQSENALMGETQEVWFIKNGFLYEVFTYKSLEPMLIEIMSTWKFY